jgi:ketosteroid isomerase-like protein
VSQENVEIVRQAYSILGGRLLITPEIEGLFDPEGEFIPAPDYPDTETRYRGVDGLHRFQRQLDEIWDDWRFETERYFDAGERVVVFLTISGTARLSRAAVTISLGHVVALRAGRILQVQAFLDRHEALKAVGLEE